MCQVMNSKLTSLIIEIQKHIQQGGMSSKNVVVATSKLNELGYSYDYETFPKLESTSSFKDTSADSPQNLAEALLWKLGKWKSYKKFASQYETGIPEPTKTDVVFFAFAQHLRDQNNPIYDQHTLRALWAVNPNLSQHEKNKIKDSLLDGSEKWKQTMNGKYTVECYRIYCKHINEIAKNGASLKEIDLLLMPLGQAIKKQTKTYNEFKRLTGTANG